MKPKIALIVDTDNWAFYNRASAISKRLDEYYDFKIIPATTALQENVMQVILLVQDCDLVHFFWRGLLFSLDNENIVFKRNKIDVNEFINEKFSKIVKTTCIPDHSLLDCENIEKTKKVLNLVDGYYTMSKRLFKIYEDLGCKKPQRTIIGGVENNYFKPTNLERFDIENLGKRKIVIGWSGNSKWGDWNENHRDLKGVHTIIKPAIEELQKEGYNVELKLADRSKSFIPIDKMQDFYNSIDIYVCASETEGGPNPILETLCCGVPIISTDVGYVPDVLGEKQRDFILKERSKEELKEKIKKLINNKKVFRELSIENLRQAEKYTYDVIANEFREFFDYNLKKSSTFRRMISKIKYKREGAVEFFARRKNNE